MIAPDALRSASDVDALAHALYGDAPLAREGVVHVTALHGARDGSLRNVLVGPSAPKSAYDHFALQLARARADAIVITGRILRDEPALHYAFVGPAADALTQWRARRTSDAPKLVVLSGGDALDLEHPVWRGEGATPVLFTGTEAATRWRARAPFAVVGHSEPSAEAAIAWLRDEGARTILIEAGPSTTKALYAADVIDELLLSVHRGPIEDAALGETLFANEAELWQRLGTGTAPVVIDEARATWALQRLPA
ncbi:MAG: dihydrofolate reductase family protein [Sandaracinus sp.]|nr:dihydrofolate reductase family protein [Sandaracinus sp.]MCB9620174.1 dihydrofolate reductase family protein [Sandaracinus sp.]